VIEGHRDADAVLLGVAAGLADEEAVVEDVAVRERRALGEARGAARVLDVDRIRGRESFPDRRQLGRIDRLSLGEQRLPVGCPQEHDLLQRRQLTADLIDHRAVVRGLQRLGGDEHPAPRLAQRVLKLGGLVCGVDIDEDHPELCRRVLHEGPLMTVGAPDPEAIAAAQARPQQPPRDPVHGRVELHPGHPHPLRTGHERVTIRPRRDRPRQVGADRLLAQRDGL
jgi:hypothetical protein